MPKSRTKHCKVSRPHHDAFDVTIPLTSPLHCPNIAGPLRSTVDPKVKNVVYEDLTLPQWVVGQLTNIHQFQDTVLLRQALLQVMLVLSVITSLPWQAVRVA